MIVVGFSGFAGAGKDEAAGALVRQLAFVRRAYADALRTGAERMNPIVGYDDTNGKLLHYADVLQTYGYARAKALFPEVRRFLQVYGTEGARDVFGANIWVDTLFDKAYEDGIRRLVIPDVRFPNEIAAIENEQGLVFRISRPGLVAVNDHASEGLTDDDFDPSMIITNNDDPKALHRKVVRRVSEAFGL